MLETIAMWGGVAGCALAFIAILAIIFIKSEIKQLLSKDRILFNENFALKKQAVENAMNIVDELEDNSNLINSPDFSRRAKQAYNALLCVCSDMRLVEAFHHITTNGANSILVAQFKLKCRNDIGLSEKNAQLVKRAAINSQGQANQTQNFAQPSYVQPAQPVQPQPMPQMARPVQQPQPMPQARPAQPARPMPQMQQPVNPNRPNNQ